jgi:deoxyguanosinetriphosphate triphosphohydrolase, putative
MPNNGCSARLLPVINPDDNFRNEYRRDYGRVLHSPAFRRLVNKTQLFPGSESDFFRNRLTHSLEVAQIAKTIALKIKSENSELEAIIEPDICEIAGLMHDLGHPPFGHNGEKALDDCMKKNGGFEGNAQTIRIITRIEKKERPEILIDAEGKDQRVGLNLTARVIASALKYDECIPKIREPEEKLVKGYYESEKSIIDEVKLKIL